MPKDRHLKPKLSARVSEEALQYLQLYAEKLEFPSVSEALDFLLLDRLAQYVEDDPKFPDSRESSIKDEKHFIDGFRAFQRKNNIPNLPDALKQYYKSDR